MRKTIWHEIKEKEQCSVGDIIATDFHIRWEGDSMDVSMNGNIDKEKLIKAIMMLLLELNDNKGIENDGKTMGNE